MSTKKFINNPSNITNELLEGFEMVFPDMVRLGGFNKHLVINKHLGEKPRVGIVSLGGSGHEPALEGYVGEGLLDISVVGDVFAAPGPKEVMEALHLADTGRGVLLIVLNHPGDVYTSNIVMEKASQQRLNVRRVIVCDDISFAPRSERDNRRGMVGAVMMYHIAGSASALGYSLDEIVRVCEVFNSNTATISVASSGATHPLNDMPITTIPKNTMVIGVGQHGEGFGKELPFLSANDISEYMLNLLIQDLNMTAKEKCLLVINGSGSTSLLEMFIVFRQAALILNKNGILLEASYCGEVLTSQEQAGFQMMLSRMDEELLSLWKHPCKSPYYSR